MTAKPFDASDDHNGVAVAVVIATDALRDRVLDALHDLDDIVLAETLGDADILLTDTMGEADVPVIVIGSRAAITVALRDGAAGGLLPSFSAAQLRAVIEAVALGLICADTRPTTPRPCPRHALTDESEAPSPLTARETEVLALLTTGASNKQIARTLEISVHTVKFHVAAIIAKLGASGRTDAVARAMRGAQAMI